jgi:cytochrome o ubiquinol oxidase subunit 2
VAKITTFNKVFGYSFVLIMASLLSGCNIAVLNPLGPIAASEKQLLIIATCLMLLVVIPVIFMTLLFAWRYRASNKNAVYTPNWADSITLEVIWWIIPIIIISILGVITWSSSQRLDPYKPLPESLHKTLTIQAVSLQWQWLFIYPEQGIATVNFLQFPVGVPIRLLITAEGPMNAIQIPQLAGQIYAMAGMQTKLHFITDVIGDYSGRGVSFTGPGFADMTFIARASTRAHFDKWVRLVKSSKQSLDWLSYQQLRRPSFGGPVRYYSRVSKGLFDDIMMYYMMPMADNSLHLITGLR